MEGEPGSPGTGPDKELISVNIVVPGFRVERGLWARVVEEGLAETVKEAYVRELDLDPTIGLMFAAGALQEFGIAINSPAIYDEGVLRAGDASLGGAP